MHRCLQLAMLGAGHVAPNPMVGAVLVHNGRIIGEGYHREYGKAHAEVNCIESVAEADKHLIVDSTLYVNLEPCAHFGKTPPCTDLIIKNNIPNVVVGSVDPFEHVDGKGIERLRQAGVEVITGILEHECKNLNRRFFTFHTKHRPFIILKWAETADSKIAGIGDKRLVISGDLTNRLVHKWRSEEAAILVGTNTALSDDPQLNNRLWVGKNPIRLVVDMDLKLPPALKIFNTDHPTIVFNLKKNTIELSEELQAGPNYYQVTADVSVVHQVLNACYQLNIQSILVEGGAKLLQSFADENLWDETRIITNQNLFIGKGLCAPLLTNASQFLSEQIDHDTIGYFKNQNT
ncbi:MAG TPA: bifunctional diaminohydroxyphosphoribosylaminopyrimidine deaminase/5-amino-6-(5-phosphoribosylamino)uracil reductase RibD [Parafilimonas sp.]|nr:bifunctional diaminohydroxyphosphoribosylaminopyrimidine deaminase/5-amino-6-(5-phosphoribosylamino)uracil reductase RibD [Parafilimonas sp.]